MSQESNSKLQKIEEMENVESKYLKMQAVGDESEDLRRRMFLREAPQLHFTSRLPLDLSQTITEGERKRKRLLIFCSIPFRLWIGFLLK